LAIDGKLIRLKWWKR